MQITATLKYASLLAGGNLRGAIFGDTRGRFNDGEYVITTQAKKISADVYQTRNSTYKVELANAVG